jgi:uncharacterized protein YcbK (DUF882 family)
VIQLIYQLSLVSKGKVTKKLSVDSDYLVTKNFQVQEFACNDGSPIVIIDVDQAAKLQKIRERVGKPIEISSGYRTEAYNTKCGGIKGSEHTKGKADDIKIAGMHPFDVAAIADSMHLFTGIGVYPTFTHVDTGNFKGYWYQNAAGKKTFYKSLEALRIAVFKK